MADCGVTISSDNFSGLTTNVVFFPASGGTITLGLKTFPFTYNSDYVYGTYECWIPSLKCQYSIVIAGPTPTPTATPPNTPTQTPTPTVTPAIVYDYDFWTDTVWNNACDEAGFGPSNVTIYSFIPWEELEVGDFVYGNSACTIPPISEIIISDGNIYIQIDTDTGLVVDTGLCP